MTIRCSRLNAIEYLLFRDLALPCFRTDIARGMRLDTCRLVGAYLDDRPAGLAVLFFQKMGITKHCRLLSLQVGTSFRGRGVGGRLLDKVLKTATGMGSYSVSLDYGQQYDWSPAMTRLCRKNKFENKEEFIVHCIRFSPSQLSDHLCYLNRLTKEREHRPGADWRLCTIPELSESEIACIRSGEELWCSNELNPFIGYGRVNPDLSLVLLKRKQVIGWLDVRDLDPGTVIFNTAFIREEYRGSKLFTHILEASLSRLKVFPEIKRAVYKTRVSNHVLLSTMDKLLSRFYQVAAHIHSYNTCRLSSPISQGRAVS
jgi:GNAT superfamily N-acetyltransferase